MMPVMAYPPRALNLECGIPTTGGHVAMKGSDKAYEIIRERLVGGHYKPGTQLKEEPLARDLNLSRTPVRAALKRLVDDGLATADAGQGVHATKWTEADIDETFQLRLLLEPYAASLAAVRGGNELTQALRDSNTRMAQAIAAGDIAGIQAANSDFHRALVGACGAPRLRGMLETMIDMPIIVRSFYIATPVEHRQSLHHHEDLTQAVAARDGELARQVMQLHLRMAYMRFMAHRSEYRASAAGGPV